MKLQKLLLIFIISVAVASSAHSQTYLIPSIGISDKGYFVAGLGFNQQIAGRIQITTEMIDLANVRSGANFGGKIGVTVVKNMDFQVVPAIGYYYHYFSADKTEYTKGKNYWSAGIFLKAEGGKWFTEAGLIKNEFTLRTGLKIKL